MDLLLDGTGLMALGHCPVLPTDNLPDVTGSLILVGPDEPAFWPIFAASDEKCDGHADPLDRWSKRVIGAIAGDIGGKAYFPSDGPPFLPFYTWALRTGRAWASPIGFLVHDSAGLWVSFRAAVWVPQTIDNQPATQPCLTCSAPCKSACPVGAFDSGYDVSACKTHINGPDTASCMDAGCAARRSCPVGQGRRLPVQARFHMEAFQ